VTAAGFGNKTDAIDPLRGCSQFRLLRGRCRHSITCPHRITSWTKQYGATQKILALCSALCDYFCVHGPGPSSFPSRTHSSILLLWWNPRAVSQGRAFFGAMGRKTGGAGRCTVLPRRLTDPPSTYYYPRLCKI
jgi:hypothetical protein